MGEINQFRDQYAFLSNFFISCVAFEGTMYPSVENAFQAAKCADRSQRTRFVTIGPSEAKRLGRQVKLRSDWDNVKLGVMRALVLDKFTRNPELRGWLLSTGDARLVEGNWWNDKYWGVDLKTGEGKNHLGEILMQVRETIRRAF